MTSLNTRIKVNNSKSFADSNLSISISEISSLTKIRLIEDGSKNSADRFESISLDEIKSILNGDQVDHFDLNTRLCIAYSRHEADEEFGSSSIEDVLDLVVVQDSGYIVSAVHSDGTVFSQINSPTIADSARVGMNMWLKTSDLTHAVFFGYQPDFVNQTQFNMSQISADSTAVYNMNGVSLLNNVGFSPVDEDIPEGWFNLRVFGDISFGGFDNVGRIWINGVEVLAHTTSSGIADVVKWSLMTLGFPNFVEDGSTGITADVADFWMSTTVDAAAMANNTKWMDENGKPISLGAAGELPTGTAADWFMSGDADHFGSNNLGSGGTVTQTGSWTNADSSPSD